MERQVSTRFPFSEKGNLVRREKRYELLTEQREGVAEVEGSETP